MTKITWLEIKKIKNWIQFWPGIRVTVSGDDGRREEVLYPFKNVQGMKITKIGIVKVEIDGEKCLGSLMIYKPIKDKK